MTQHQKEQAKKNLKEDQNETGEGRLGGFSVLKRGSTGHHLRTEIRRRQGLKRTEAREGRKQEGRERPADSCCLEVKKYMWGRIGPKETFGVPE